MPFFARLALILFLVGCCLCARSSAAQSVREIGGGTFDVPRAVAVDGSGNLFVLDPGAQAIKEVFAPGGYVTLQEIVPPASANLANANAIAVDSRGNIFVSSLLYDTVIEIVATGGYTVVKPVAVSTGNFNHPFAMALDAADNLFVVDVGNGKVKEILAADGYVTVKPLAASFTFPFALVMDGQGNLFVGDSNSGTDTGRIVEILAEGGYTRANPLPLPEGSVNAPLSLAMDQSGNLFSLDASTLAISEFPAQSGYTTSQTVAGSGNFVRPSAIALDRQGNLFVTDADGNQVEEFFTAGGYASGAEIAPNEGNFRGPGGLAVDSSGNVFVTDTGNGVVKEIMAAGGYNRTVPIARGFNAPQGIALDAAGNIFVADTDNNAVKEILAQGGYATVRTLAAPSGGFARPQGVAVDQHGNVFVADGGVWEILAAGGYVTVSALNSWGGTVTDVAVDGEGNVFATESGYNQIEEILAASGYATIVPVPVANGKFSHPAGLSVDAAGNVYVTDATPAVTEILASGGYVEAQAIAPGQFRNPSWVATDARGTVFVSDSGLDTYAGGTAANHVVQVVPQAAPLVAAVLPGSRSVEIGAPATIFATILNTGSTALSGCGVLPAASSPAGLTLQYQATDPRTNQATGAVDTPVAIAANGSQTFVLTIVEDDFSVTGLLVRDYAPVFTCDGVGPAPVTPGVNTVFLSFSTTPTADIIALAATPSGNGIVTVPFSTGGKGAFALATINEGVSATITVEVDTGSADLPIAVTLCQTDPATAQCLAAPSTSVSLPIASGATPTFSLFVSATAPVTLAPGASRIFVWFADAGGTLLGSTSVAVETD